VVLIEADVGLKSAQEAVEVVATYLCTAKATEWSVNVLYSYCLYDIIGYNYKLSRSLMVAVRVMGTVRVS
jgi:hypothetical protein